MFSHLGHLIAEYVSRVLKPHFDYRELQVKVLQKRKKDSLTGFNWVLLYNDDDDFFMGTSFLGNEVKSNEIPRLGVRKNRPSAPCNWNLVIFKNGQIWWRNLSILKNGPDWRELLYVLCLVDDARY